MQRHFRLAIAVAAVFLLASPSANAAAVPVDHPHAIGSYTYIAGDDDCKGTSLCHAAPTEVVTRGDTLTFVNLDSFVTFHTVDSDVAGQFASGLIGVGAQPTATIDTSPLTAGNYGYHCALHPAMHGSFTVVATRP
jgi:hypothetical protein